MVFIYLFTNHFGYPQGRPTCYESGRGQLSTQSRLSTRSVWMPSIFNISLIGRATPAFWTGLKAHYLTASRVTRVTPVCCRCLYISRLRVHALATSREHILASPGYAPGTIAVNVTWIEREFNACLVKSHRRLAACTYLSSTVCPFPSNSTRKFKSSPF